MTNDTTNFIHRLKSITLSANERLAMRERLAGYADMHPVFDAATAPTGGFFAFFSSRRFSLYAGALMALLVLGGGVTLAAEGSAPGDSLYAIKVNINEPMMTAFAPTKTGQARVAADIAARRVDEAVVLASRGELTPERTAYLKTEFGKKLAIAAKKADDLANTGDATAAQTVKDELAVNLATEAQALGASGNGSPEGRREFLTLLAETDETIAGDDTEAATAVTVAAATDEGATSTATTFAASAKMAAPVATSTTERPGRALLRAIRFARLHLNASTTLPTTLSGEGIAAPKLDTAIPTDDSAPTETDLTATEGK